MFDIQVWDLFWGFMSGIGVRDSDLESMFWMQVWDSGLGVRFWMQVLVSGLEFRFYIQV